MRRLTKSSIPPVLQQQGQVWTDEYAINVQAGNSPQARWRHPEIVAGLRSETCGKCAYCEAIIADVAHPHVEHIVPKSARPDLVLSWSNLTLACPVCNSYKGSYHSPESPLLHPYEDDPTCHLEFRGPAIFAALGSDVGRRTVERLKLMRSELVTERLRAIQRLYELLGRWMSASGADKDMWAEVILAELGDDKEFTQSLRAFAASFGFPTARSF